MKEKKYSKTDKPESFMLILGIALVFASVVYFFTGYETTHDAVVEGKMVSISARIGGQVLNVFVEDGQEVKKGDLLLEVESQPYLLKLRDAESELNHAKVRLLMCERPDRDDIIISDERQRRTKSLIDSKYVFARSDLDKFAKMFSGNVQKRKDKLNPLPKKPKPANPLYQQGVVGQNMQTSSVYQVSSNGHNMVATQNAQVNQNMAGVNGQAGQQNMPNGVQPQEEDEEDYAMVDTVELKEQIKELESKVADCKLNLSYTRVYATQDGTISSRNVKVGDEIEVGQELLNLVPKNVWIIANYKKSQADKMHEGQVVYIKSEDFPRKFFKGVVESVDDFDSVAKLDGQEVSEPLMSDKVPVRIAFTKDYSEYNFVPGMAVSTAVRVH